MTPMLYRVFSRTLIVFFALLIAFGGVSPAKAGPQDTYTAKAVTVDVQGTSALDARNKAFAQARLKAYQDVVSRLYPGKDMGPAPDDKVIASAVRDFEIVSEKMTTRRYAGTIDVRFTPAAFKRVVQAAAANAQAAPEGDIAQVQNPSDAIITGNDRPAPEQTRRRGEDDYIYAPPARRVPAAAPSGATLVLPWYGLTGRQTLWGQGNPWRAAWEEHVGLNRDKAMPVVLPVGDVSDLRDYSPPQPLSRRGDIDALMKRYGASQAVLADAQPQGDGSVIVALYRYENGTMVPVGRVGVDSTSSDVLGEAVAKSLASLKSMPAADPAPTQVSIAPGVTQPSAQTYATAGSYRTLARFSNVQEWVAMRQALSRLPGMGALTVHSISPSQANIEFDYSGDVNALAASMAQAGLQFAMLQPGTQIAALPGDVPPQYVLTLGRAY
jgi:hypothetical protein